MRSHLARARAEARISRVPGAAVTASGALTKPSTGVMNMAATESIAASLDALHEELLLVESMCAAFGNIVADVQPTEASLAGHDPHAWVFVMQRSVRRVRAASEELEQLVRREAMPALRDREAIRTHVQKGHA